MGQIVKFQNNFTTGVISPGVQARTDLEKYAAACSKLVNAVVRPHGGVSKRPGTEYVDTLPAGGVLIPFTYSVEQTYVLCFYGAEDEVTMRVYADGGVIIKNDGSILEVPTPYKPDELPKIKFAQSADVLFLVHPNHNVYKLQRFSHDNWVFEVLRFEADIQPPTGLKATPKGFATSGRADTVEYKVASVNAREKESVASEAVSASIRATWTQGATVQLEWDAVPKAAKYEVYKNSRGYYGWIGTAESNTYTDDNIEPDEGTGPKEQRDPFEDVPTVTEIKLLGEYSDTPTEEYPRKIGVGLSLVGNSGQEGVGAYSVKYVANRGADALPANLALDLSDVIGKPYQSAIMYFDDEKTPGGGDTPRSLMYEIPLEEPKVEVTTFTLAHSSGTAFKLNEEGTGTKYYYNVVISDTGSDTQGSLESETLVYSLPELRGFFYTDLITSSAPNLKLTYNLKLSNIPYTKYRIRFSVGYEREYNAGKIVGHLVTLADQENSEEGGVIKGTVTVKDESILSYGNYLCPYILLTSAALFEERQGKEPLTEVRNKPGAVGVFQQRLVFGRTNAEPQTVWVSETGAFDSMAVATPLRDDSAITATVDSKQMNEIRHFLPLRDMLMFTSGAEFKITSATQGSGGAVTPKSIAFPNQSYWGVSDVPPLVVGTSILFIQNSNRHVRDLQYTLQEDGYSGNEITILAEHLIDSDIVDWAYQQSPYSAVWVCLANGKLLTLTYMKDQNIWAWSEHESAGGKFRGVCCIREGAEDAVYFLVERDGIFYMEHQVRRDYGDDLKGAFFVDCGLRYEDENKPIKHVTNLNHLANKEIAVLADGTVFYTKVAEDGSFDLPFEATKISAGLPYTMTLETLDPEIQSNSGALVGEKRNIFKAVILLRESLSMEIGPTEESMVRVKLPQAEVWGEPPKLFTGEVATVLPGLHREKATLIIKQTDPVPCTILGLCKYITIG